MATGANSGVSDLAKAEKHRREDAQALFDARRWRGSMYMAGYTVECLLKTKLMRKYGCQHLRELEEELQRRGILAGSASVLTHQLGGLLALTGGKDRMRNTPSAWVRFNVVNAWLPSWRYSADLASRGKADDFLTAVDSVRRWIENNI